MTHILRGGIKSPVCYIMLRGQIQGVKTHTLRGRLHAAVSIGDSQMTDDLSDYWCIGVGVSSRQNYDCSHPVWRIQWATSDTRDDHGLQRCAELPNPGCRNGGKCIFFTSQLGHSLQDSPPEIAGDNANIWTFHCTYSCNSGLISFY